MTIRSFCLFGLLCIGLIGNAIADLDDGIVAHYKFDNNVNDAIGNHDGLNGGGTFISNRNEKPNSAIYFNGSSKVTILDSNSFGTQDLTVAAFVYYDKSFGKEQRRIINQQEPEPNIGNGWGLQFFGPTAGQSIGTQLNFHVGGVKHSRDYVTCLAPTNMQINTWYHVAATHNSSTNEMKLYIDGQLKKSCISRGLNSNINSNIVIGRTTASNRFFWKGGIDEIYIHNRALSNSEIQQLYLRNTVTPTPIETYSWQTGSWSSCIGDCGSNNGIRTRSVLCLSSTGQNVNDSNCSSIKPTTIESCTTSICPVSMTVPNSPILSLSVNGINVFSHWQNTNSDGYEFFYAPYPSAPWVRSIDLGKTTNISAELTEGDAYYIAVKAYNTSGQSELSNIEYFQIDMDSISSQPDLNIIVDGVSYGVPKNIFKDRYIYDNSGLSVKPTSTIAAKLFAASIMLQEIEDNDFSGLSDTLKEVIIAASVASAVNAAGDITETALKTMAETAVQSVIAPITGGTSVINLVASKVADAIDVVNIDIEKVKFYLGIALVADTNINISVYLNDRDNLLQKVNTNRNFTYDEVYDLWKLRKVISELAPFSSKMTLSSVTKGNNEKGFIKSFFSNLLDKFKDIAFDIGVDLSSGTVKLAISAMNIAENSIEIGIVIKNISEKVKSIYDLGNDSLVSFSSKFAKDKGLTSN